MYKTYTVSCFCAGLKFSVDRYVREFRYNRVRYKNNWLYFILNVKESKCTNEKQVILGIYLGVQILTLLVPIPYVTRYLKKKEH